MPIDLSAIQEITDRRYPPEECPALAWLRGEWRHTRPLEGLRILDATPLFHNTLVKHLALLEGGAQLAVGLGDAIPADPQAIELLRQAGIPVLAQNDAAPWTPDIVLDCAGVHRHRRPRLGAVELTRSGAHYYQHAPYPVLLADDSRCKLVETMLGTGDGFRRAMAQLGHGDFACNSVVVFGCGKVGRGVALAAQGAGAQLTVVDDAKHCSPPAGMRLIDLHDRAAIAAAVRAAWCVVTVTGVRNAIVQCIEPQILINSKALLANMGAEDEYGPAIPADRVLADKQPLNFLLEEPTRMRYIDPTMALDNLCALELLAQTTPPGLHPAPRELDANVLAIEVAHSRIAEEISAAGLANH